MAVTQSQYATDAEIQLVSITPAAANRFGLAAINSALKFASSIADSYLATQFVLPLQTSPQGWDMALTSCVCEIATYRLYSQFGYNPGAPADDLVQKRYESAIKWLEQIRDEEIFPQYLDSAALDPATNNKGPYVDSDPPVGFTNRGLGFRRLDGCGFGFGWDD